MKRVGKHEIWRGPEPMPWKLGIVYFGQERVLEFPERQAAERYLGFLQEQMKSDASERHGYDVAE